MPIEDTVREVIQSATYDALCDVKPAAASPEELTVSAEHVLLAVDLLRNIEQHNGFHGVQSEFRRQTGVKLPLEVFRRIDEVRRQVASEKAPAPELPVPIAHGGIK